MISSAPGILRDGPERPHRPGYLPYPSDQFASLIGLLQPRLDKTFHRAICDERTGGQTIDPAKPRIAKSFKVLNVAVELSCQSGNGFSGQILKVL
jgi:hypothetical protein